MIARRGVLTRAQYERSRLRPGRFPPVISCELLDVADDCSEQEERMFEEAQFFLRTPNATFRTSFPGRFRDVDAAALKLLGELSAPDAPLRIQDRAASHALTSCEWAEAVLPAFPCSELEASDLAVELLLISCPGRGSYVADGAGDPLQYVRGPFVVSLCGGEPRRYLLNRALAAWARKRFPRGLAAGAGKQVPRGVAVRRVSFVHPRARRLGARNPRFRVVQRSVFEYTPPVGVIRTMNILNRSYFGERRLAEGVAAVFASLADEGVWIAGKTSEATLRNDATFFQKTAGGWASLGRIGEGSELEALLSRSSPAAALRAVW